MSKVHSRTPKRPTQFDVAKLAAVSQATVSLVRDNNQSVAVAIPKETRQRILDAVQELNYFSNRAAQMLRTQKTFTVACVLPDITNPFCPAIERGVQQFSDKYDYDLIIYNSDGQAEKERKILAGLRQGRDDGVIGIFFHVRASELIELIHSGTAVVRIESRARSKGKQPLDNVYVDNTAAALAAIGYLYERGHRKVVMITAPFSPQPARVEGYLRAAERYGLEPWIIDGADFSEDRGRKAMTSILSAHTLPDAVFAANDHDLMAVGALFTAQAAGLQVPSDVVMMGFDDIHLARLVTPSLATVRQPQDRLGSRAAELLFDRLEGGRWVLDEPKKSSSKSSGVRRPNLSTHPLKRKEFDRSRPKAHKQPSPV